MRPVSGSMTPVLRTPHLSLMAWQSMVMEFPTQLSGVVFGAIGVLPTIGVPSVGSFFQSSTPVCASTARTTFAIDGSTMTSCFEPSGSFTLGRMSGCASIPRASPYTGMMVARTIPFAVTLAWVSSVSCGFHPLRALSADRVSQGTIDCAEAPAGARNPANNIAQRAHLRVL